MSFQLPLNRRQALARIATAPFAAAEITRTFAAEAARGKSTSQSQPLPEAGFDQTWLVAEAQRLAGQPYKRREADLPEGFGDLTYDQYRDIRFREDKRIWLDDGLQFQLDVLPTGFFFTMPVAINIVEAGRVTALKPSADMFDYGPLVKPPPAGTSLPFSGFRVRNQINNPGVWDEFLVFQGASYFRAVAKSQLYGLSTRGLAVNTAEPDGEEFPDFTEFWIEKPGPANSFIVIHALLEGPSFTGAYKFTTRPGPQTEMDVEATIILRKDVTRFGLGPLTTMFVFDSTNRHRFDDFRPAVHDSSGLQMLSGAGEWIWRPLANPLELQVSAFLDDGIRGFGLIQRSREFADFQDIEARYERRPSLWVEPIGNWGKGSVELVEIPTTLETNDNIVAFWKPDTPLETGKPFSVSYRLYWGNGPDVTEGLAQVHATRKGRSFDGKRVLIVIDYDQAPSGPARLPKLEVTASAGVVSNTVLVVNPHSNGLRASFELDTQDITASELRVQLKNDAKPASETWLYRWTQE